MNDHTRPSNEHDVDPSDEDFGDIPLDEIIGPGRAIQLLDNLRNKAQRDEAKQTNVARHAMVLAYQIALAARHHNDLWSEICHHPRWEANNFRNRPKLDQQHDCLQAVIRLTVGFGGVADNKTVSARLRAMRKAFENGESHNTVRQLLERHGGAEGLISWYKEAEKAGISSVVLEQHSVTLRFDRKKFDLLGKGVREAIVRVRLKKLKDRKFEAVLLSKTILLHPIDSILK